MKFLRYILVPLVPVYWLVTWLRNCLYDVGILPSQDYEIPVICVGNLSTGGTGKTPMVENIIEILQPNYKIAVLSRGYKRKTKSYVLAKENSTVDELGDESFQIHKKFKDLIVAVDSDRRNGIKQLLNLKNPPDIIILDDAYQHRGVKAGLNILLTTFQNPYYGDVLLPTGNLREPKSGSKRADIIVVTKSPEKIKDAKLKAFRNDLKMQPSQKLFFSTITYGDIKYTDIIERQQKVTVVTGIANPKPFIKYLKSQGLIFEHLEFPDHHKFSQNDILELRQREFILTTEKDFVRLDGLIEKDKLQYVPIKTKVLDGDIFQKEILQFIENYSIGAAED